MKFILSYIIIGLLLFSSLAAFDASGWVYAYAIWDKLKDVLLLYAFFDLCNKPYKKIVKPVLWLLSIRLVWEFVSIVTGLSINNNIVVAILFISYLIYVLYITFKNVRN